MDGTDGGVGDDFPDDFPDGDLPDDGALHEGALHDGGLHDGALHDGGLPDDGGLSDAGALPDVGDSLADTIDLDGDHAVGDHTVGDHAVGDVAWTAEAHDTPDLAADSYDPPDADDSYDAPDAEPDADDVPVVGDDTPVGLGADPDVPAGDSGDGGWLDLPDLTDVDIPEPAGGPPWVDTGLLGDSDSDTPDVPVTGDSVPVTPEGGADDLRSALGEPATVGDPTDDAYQDLVTSDDPAVRNLARLWGPPA